MSFFKYKIFRVSFLGTWLVVMVGLMSLSCLRLESAVPEDQQQYIDFFEEVYTTMQENYYRPIDRQEFERFLEKFSTKIYPQLKNDGKTEKFVKWRSAAFLVDDLKSPEDKFSTFIPPKFAPAFEQKVLGKKVDLGIEGQQTKAGFLVTMIEPRSDAYIQGLRIKDIIVSIDQRQVTELTQEEIKDFLNPLENAKVRIDFIQFETQETKSIEPVSQEYFKQTVFITPVGVEDVHCLQIRSFNQKTSEDMFRYLTWIKEQNNVGLILDLRSNPGGPPLAAREISAFFLTPKEEFAYFQKKGKPKAILDVPEIPESFRYAKPIAILVDQESGSAAELFSGVLQRFGRATLFGTHTAGAVLLKSMFNLKDESMLLLVTSRGHFADGSVFSFGGLTPDHLLEETGDSLLKEAAWYLQGKASAIIKNN